MGINTPYLVSIAALAAKSVGVVYPSGGLFYLREKTPEVIPIPNDMIFNSMRGSPFNNAVSKLKYLLTLTGIVAAPEPSYNTTDRLCHMIPDENSTFCENIVASVVSSEHFSGWHDRSLPDLKCPVCETDKCRARRAIRSKSWGYKPVEETIHRQKSVKQLAEYVWMNYSLNAFGSPEMDPRNSIPTSGEWPGEPMFILDNIDALWLFGFDTQFNKVVKWLEIVTILQEAYNGRSDYLRFWQDFYDLELWEAVGILNATNDWVEGRITNEDLSKMLLLDFEAMNFPNEEMTVNLLQAIKNQNKSLPTFLNHQVSFFETTIRGLGGLISGYALSLEPILLYKSWELGHKLSRALWVCQESNQCLLPDKMCLPPRIMNLEDWNHSINWSQHIDSSPAVIGTNQLEFLALSEYTGICQYAERSESVRQWVVRESGMATSGIIPLDIGFPNADERVNTRISLSNRFSLASEGDSFYEYIIKSLFQHNHTALGPILQETANAFLKSSSSFISINKFLSNHSLTTLQDFITREQRNHITNFEAVPSHTHLGCFAGGLLAIAAQNPRIDEALKPRLRKAARDITDGCVEMYESSPIGLAMESYTISPSATTGVVPNNHKVLIRPETLESLFWLYSTTDNPRYKDQAWKIFEALAENATVKHGICSIDDGRTDSPRYDSCRQDTWILAETLKYAYLIFTPSAQIKQLVAKLLPQNRPLRENGLRAVRRALQRTARTCPDRSIDVAADLYPYRHDGKSIGDRLSPHPMKPNFTECSGWTRNDDSDILHCVDLFSDPRGPNDVIKLPFVFSTEAHPLPLASDICFTQLGKNQEPFT